MQQHLYGYRPSDAVNITAKELSGRFNSKRQAPGKQVGPKIKKGDWVMVLDSAALYKKGKFYKSYRDHWSKPMKVEKIVGLGVRVGGTSYPRARVKKVSAVDKKSLTMLEPKKIARAPKKKAGKTVSAPRRSGRTGKKLWSERDK